MPDKPRQERWMRTRSSLLDAAVRCLVRHGYVGTTLQRVQETAGVSRGALVHHYASRSELLVAAVHHVAEGQLDELGRALPTVDDLRDDTPAARRARVVDLLHSFMSGPRFLAGLELWMAARTDATLRTALIPAEREVGAALQRHLTGTLIDDQGAPLARLDLEELLSLLRGLAITSVLRRDPAVERAVLEQWCERTLA
ncbi:TetR/AcrR family transcriptional regulator [Mumia sp. DW29H23]|uniref:TetR/AcrR family transcriptional regulator n=1 Tax=Mumia sp. DW29H23 TaxID=3421241 RepID=UPI003D69B5DE